MSVTRKRSRAWTPCKLGFLFLSPQLSLIGITLTIRLTKLTYPIPDAMQLSLAYLIHLTYYTHCKMWSSSCYCNLFFSIISFIVNTNSDLYFILKNKLHAEVRMYVQLSCIKEDMWVSHTKLTWST